MALALLALVAGGCSLAARGPRDAGVAAQIRARRAELATAWNAADTVALGRLEMANFVFVGDRGVPYTATEMREQVRQVGAAALRTGRSSMQWTPQIIRVYAPWRIAVETGDALRVSRSGDDAPADSVRSVYTAQWFRGPQGWQIQAEIQSPVACAGAARFCGAR